MSEGGGAPGAGAPDGDAPAPAASEPIAVETTPAEEEEGPKLKMNFKVSGGTNFSKDIPSSKIRTVGELKSFIEEESKIPNAAQKIVFKGKTLKDEDVLTEKKIGDGATITSCAGLDTCDPTTGPSESSMNLRWDTT